MKRPARFPNLRHLKMFLSVCELGSLNAASKGLNVAQPAITQALSRLEDYYEVSLLTRRSGGSQPTEEGKVLWRRCERFFRLLQRGIVLASERAAAPTLTQSNHIMARLTAAQIFAHISVSHYGSLLLAAKADDISVSALHRAVRDIESNLGYELYTKTPQGLSVNRAGAELARQFRIALRELVTAEEELKGSNGSLKGRVLIASLPMIRSSILGKAINRTRARAPELDFVVLEGIYDTMLKALRSGEADMLIGAIRKPPPSNDVIENYLFSDPYSIIARKGHPLEGKDVSIDDLALCEWVAQHEGTPVRSALNALFDGRNEGPRVRIEAPSTLLIRSILLDSEALAILSVRQVALEVKMGLLTPLRFQTPRGGRAIGITMRSDWLPSKTQLFFLENFYEVLSEEIEGFVPPK
jgi:LysR family transcriptional regulator, regulator for genes of the gallate degradation pathway